MIKRLISAIIFLLFYSISGLAAEHPLPVDQAFKLSSSYTSEHFQLHWQIAKGTYLYRDKIKIDLIKPTTQKLGTIQMPSSITKQNQILGNFEAYEQPLTINIPLAYTEPVALNVHYQGCAKTGFCYPPQTRLVSLQNGQMTIINPDNLVENSQDKITRLLNSHNYLPILLGFLGFGLLLAFTPCVFPMIPILSGIIVGQKLPLTTGMAFRLSLAYVLAMALTYAMAGILAAYAGSYLQGLFQTPWAIALFSITFVLLALSLFGLYDLQLPANLQQKLINLSNRQRGGQYLGVMIMGGLATLIVSPCVSAPLVGALGYIGQTGDAVLGGLALFMLGLGMGLPLLVIGTSAGKLLPKAGRWLELIKQAFGLLLLMMAIGLIGRILAEWITHLLWALLAVGVGIYLIVQGQRLTQWPKIARIMGFSVVSLGILFIANRLVIPRLGFTQVSSTQSKLSFKEINNQAELTAALIQAEMVNKPVILDFYADWCIACIDLEKNVLADPSVQNHLQDYIRLRANVTQLTKDHKQLMQNLQVIAPPTLVFFNDKQEMKPYRLVGEVTTNIFNQHLQAVLGTLLTK